MSKYRKNNEIIRSSAVFRISFGTVICTLFGTLYSLSLYKYRKLNNTRFIKNWLYGSFLGSFSFYTINELMFSTSNFFGIYTNYWINYTIAAYYLHKIQYRYLIKHNNMKWTSAIMYSQKCFLVLVSFSLLIEKYIDLHKFILLYNEEDIIDMSKRYFEQTEENCDKENIIPGNIFLQEYYIINDEEKYKKLVKYANKKNENTKTLKFVNIYEFCKEINNI